jgi:hypothetical protein
LGANGSKDQKYEPSKGTRDKLLFGEDNEEGEVNKQAAAY